MSNILINFGNIDIQAHLNHSSTAQKIQEVLPLETSVNTWGEEIYFSLGKLKLSRLLENSFPSSKEDMTH